MQPTGLSECGVQSCSCKLPGWGGAARLPVSAAPWGAGLSWGSCMEVLPQGLVE